MSVAKAARRAEAPPARAFDLWVDTTRWAAFVDGFHRVEQLDPDWPAAGSEVVWMSVPGGRGRVVERVLQCKPGELFETDVAEERLVGRQALALEPDGDGVAVRLSLDYELTGGGPLRKLTDMLFIRRAENDALARTLVRFAAEAGTEAAL